MVAYTRYSFFEWALIFLDVLYDSSAELDFEAADLKVGLSIHPPPHGKANTLPPQITIGNLVGGTTDTDKMYQKLHRLA